jgi:inner membrane protein
MAWWIWIILGAALLAAEAIVVADFYLVFFGLAAIVLGLLGVLGVGLPGWIQFLLFATLASASLVLYRNRLKRRVQGTDRVLQPELVGETGIAREAIAPQGRGRISLRGADWEARNTGATMIDAGTRCVVREVEGLTLHVQAED